MAVELASAYVTIVPTTKGITAGLEKELSPLSGVAAKAGDESGNALGKSFSGASGGLKASLGEAEGHFAKFKNGAVSALDSVGVSTGMLKIAGVGALAEFGLKAVEAFEHTALAARDLGAATGLSVEDASRWIGVAKDFGINADTLTQSLGKVGKTLDNTKWAAFGIATKDAGGQTRKVNDILLDTFDKLGKITNETDRANEGNKLFGKGYANIAPLIGKTREELQKYLGAVEDGQVITDGELKKAEAMHHAQEALKQAFGEVTLAVGGEVAALAPLIEVIAKVVGQMSGSAASRDTAVTFEAVGNAMDKIHPPNEDINHWLELMAKGNLTIEQLDQAMKDSKLSTVELAASLRDQAAASAETAREDRRIVPVWEQVGNATAAAAAEAANYKYQSDNTKRAVQQNLDEIKGSWDVLTGNVNADKSWLTLQGTFDTLKAKAVDAFTAAANHADDADAKMRDYKAAIDDTTLGVGTYGQEVIKIPKNWATIFKSEIDQGSFDIVENQLAILTRNRTMTLAIQAKGGSGVFTVSGLGPAGATGGWRSGPTLVGEKGPELVDFKQPSFINTAAETRSIFASSAAMMQSAAAGPTIYAPVINNNRRDIGVADLNHVLAMARLS